MEKKYYQIVAKSSEDWKVVHELLMQDGSLEDNIPHHCIECVNDIKHSETRSTYLMTDEEADLVRQSDRILSVGLDITYHPEAAPKITVDIKKHGRSVFNYRSLRQYNQSTSSSQNYLPVDKSDSDLSAERYRTGYQILRCTSENNPFPLPPSTSTLYQDIDYSTDGTDVDCIVVDDGCFIGHPEFCSDEYDPPNYIRGNVLSRHGISGVLDLVLDAPYYLDPDWFNADPTNRLEKRWDGTVVPKEQSAKDWWSSQLYRSASFYNFGNLNTISSEYTRSANYGSSQQSPPSNQSTGSHGTSCASLMYGKNYGWAFNSNKWSITLNASTPEGVSVTTGVSVIEVFDIIKIFHYFKPINPKFGTQNPTVASNSWSSAVRITQYAIDAIDPISNQPQKVGQYSYRNGPLTTWVTEPNRNLFYSSYPNFLKTTERADSSFPLFYNDTNDLLVTAGKELVNSGVIFVASAGNSSRYIGGPNDVDFNNHIVVRVKDSDPNKDGKYYVNRFGFPAQIGYDDGSLVRNKTILIGAIDDEYTGRYGDELNTNTTYTSEPAGKETLARSGEEGGASGGRDYSNKGTAIDFYAPADGTLAASSDVTSQIYPNSYQPFANITYNDRSFNGTSAACPVAAGLIACFAQNNRDMSAFDMKMYLRNNIRSQNSSEFFIGPRPGNDPNDSAWIVPYSLMGNPLNIKIIKEVTTRNATPNPTFTPTYGINSSFGANERFVITQNSFLSHKIEILGIKNFDETPATYELNVKTGYYKVGSRFTAYLGSSAFTFNQLKDIKLRVDPSNSKRLQLTDTDGVNSWDDMEITVTNGEFIQVSTEIYYKFSGGTLSTSPAYSPSPAPPTPSYTPPSPGAPGSIVSTGGNLVVTGNITAGGDIFGLVSDERLKENIKPIDNALDKIKNLEGFTYNFNEVGEKLGFDPNERHSGVSAQDVKNVLPEASAPAPRDNNYLTVKYDKLIPLLIEGIKDLKNNIDDLKNKDDNNK